MKKKVIMKNNISKEEAKEISRLALYFTILAILFIVLSTLILGPIFTLIFIIPIYISLNGIKKKRKSGFYVALGMIPLSLGVASIWIRNDIAIYRNFSKEFEIIRKTNQSITENTVKIIAITSFIFSLIVIVLALISFVKFIKNRSFFDR